jgi:hypothetical protein
MTVAQLRRYPVTPLLDIIGTASSRVAEQQYGIHHTTVNRWRNKPETVITEWDADRYAVAMGKHPGELWHNWFDVNTPIAPWRKLKVNA